VRESFFSAHTPEAIVIGTAARVQEESPRASGPDMTFLNLVKPEKIRTPLLVLGAEEDGSYATRMCDERRALINRKQSSFPAWDTT
jgi:hypothetical protein